MGSIFLFESLFPWVPVPVVPWAQHVYSYPFMQCLHHVFPFNSVFGALFRWEDLVRLFYAVVFKRKLSVAFLKWDCYVWKSLSCSAIDVLVKFCQTFQRPFLLCGAFMGVYDALKVWRWQCRGRTNCYNVIVYVVWATVPFNPPCSFTQHIFLHFL